MASSLNGTGVTFSNGSTQSVAWPGNTGTVTSVSGSGGLTGTVTTSGSLSIDTSTYAIGQIISGRPANNTNYTVGSTVAGSSLYTTPTGYVRSSSPNWGVNTYFGGTNGPPAPTLINTGTWKCISPALQVVVCEAVGMCGMWVRTS